MRSPFWLSLVLATLATMICPAARGATSIVDPTFRVGALTATQGPDGLVTAMDRYSDGRVIIAGDFARVDGRKAHGIARLRSDGSNDTTFDVGTGPDRLIRTVVVLPDGRALVGGDFGSWNGTPAGQHIVRLNADGSRDVGYPAGIASTGSVRQLLVRPDGRVLVLETLGPEANGKHALKLLSGDGLRDPAYQPDIPDGAILNQLVPTPDASVLVVGGFNRFNGLSLTNLVRLRADLSLDENYQVSLAQFLIEIKTAAVAPDGRIALSGYFLSPSTDPNLILLDRNGKFVAYPRFSPGGYFVLEHAPTGLAFDSHGFLEGLVEVYTPGGGTVSTGFQIDLNGKVTRLSFNGRPDGCPPLPLADETILWASDGVQSNGGLLTRWLVRTQNDGTWIGGAQIDPALSEPVRTFAHLADGALIVPGSRSNATIGSRPTVVSALLRSGADGESFEHFATLTTLTEPTDLGNTGSLELEQLVVSGIQVYAAGGFSIINGTSGFDSLARLNPDGSVDPSFRSGVSVTYPFGQRYGLHQIEVSPDAGLWVAGNTYSPIYGVDRLLFGRLLSDGVLDAADTLITDDRMVVGTPEALVRRFASNGEGQCLLWGQLGRTYGKAFYWYDGSGTNRSGPSLTAAVGKLPDISTLFRMHDRRFLIGGTFSQVAGVPRNSIARLHPDLTVDATFDPGIGPDGSISTGLELSDGRILVGGSFTHWNGGEHRRVVLLTPDGHLDPAFDPGTGPDDAPQQFIELPDGRILIGGGFSQFDGSGSPFLTRIVPPQGAISHPAQLIVQPRSGFTTNLVAPVVLHAEGIGTAPLSWRWYRDGELLMDGDGYVGAGSPELAIQPSNLKVARVYWVEISNSFGRERSDSVVVGLASGANDPMFSWSIAGAPNSHLGGLERIPASLIQETPIAGLVGQFGADGRVGRLFVYGNFTNYDSFLTPGMVMLRPDGSRDPDWSPPLGMNGTQLTCATFLPNGGMFLAGVFNRSGGAPRDLIVRLQSNGAVDSQFDPGDSFLADSGGNLSHSSISAMALDGEGVYIGGALSGLDQVGKIRRLDASGKRDPTFAAEDVSMTPVSILAVQPGEAGGLLVAGRQLQVSPASGPMFSGRSLARFSRSGSLDFAYHGTPLPSDQTANNTLYSVVPVDPFRTFVAGAISTFDGIAGPLISLGPTGDADNGFKVHLSNPEGGATGGTIRDFAPLSEGRYLVGYESEPGILGSLVQMEADGTETVQWRTSGIQPEQVISSPCPIVPMGDGSCVALITFRDTRSTGYRPSIWTLGRFWLGTLPQNRAATLPPVLFVELSNRLLETHLGFREPLVLSVPFQSGGPTLFQWYRDDIAILTATNSAFTIASPSSSDSGRYRVIVSNGAGSVSSEATVTVRAAAPTVPSLQARLVSGDRPLRLKFIRDSNLVLRLESSIDLQTWQPVSDPAAVISDSEYALSVEVGGRFYRLAAEP